MRLIMESWRNFLTEGKYESATTEITRRIVKEVKNFIIPRISELARERPSDLRPTAFQGTRISGKLLPSELQGSLYEIYFEFSVDEELLRSHGRKFSTAGFYHREERMPEFSSIVIKSNFSLSFSEKDLSDYLGSLKATLIHELQHSGQSDDVLGIGGKKQNLNFNSISVVRDYYLSKAEVDAKAKELYKRAKHYKKPFSEILEQEIEYILSFLTTMLRKASSKIELTEEELESFFRGEFKDVLTAYVKKNYPKAKF